VRDQFLKFSTPRQPVVIHEPTGRFPPNRAGRLETEIAHSQRTPASGSGQVRSPGHSLHQVDHRRSENDDAYFRRAIANLYSGALTKRVDMTHASDLDPTYAYYAIWLDILSKRNHQASVCAGRLSNRHDEMARADRPHVPR